MSIAIIGAGLAGTACAYALKQAGLDAEIYEAGPSLAGGASGNTMGLVNPRLSADRNPESDFYASSFAMAVRSFDAIQKQADIGWHKGGGLHLMIEEKKQKRLPHTVANWGWPEAHMRIVPPAEASEIAGLPIAHEALYLPDAGCVNPSALCRFYAQESKIHLNARIESLSDIKADAIILACGAAAKNFRETEFLPLSTVRGQITRVKATEESLKLHCNIGYGGYCSPALNGEHMVGATFQRWLDHTDLQPEDDRENITLLQQYVPALQDDFEILGSRAALRTASKDHFPIAGRLAGHAPIYLSLAHGSHGIATSLGAAHLLADMILGRPFSQSRFSVNALAADRFR